jgi:hypothetical protein
MNSSKTEQITIIRIQLRVIVCRTITREIGWIKHSGDHEEKEHPGR